MIHAWILEIRVLRKKTRVDLLRIREEEDILPWRLCWRDSYAWIFSVVLGFDDLF
jgi:hypothetical protein